MRVEIPAEGWRRGLALIPVYAPTSDRAHNEKRAELGEEIEALVDTCKKDLIPVVGGGLECRS